MEIRYGKDNTVFELIEVSVDYVKTPQYLLLTQEQLDLTEWHFSDYGVPWLYMSRDNKRGGKDNFRTKR